MGQQNHIIFQNSDSFGNKVMSGIKNTAEVVGAGKQCMMWGRACCRGSSMLGPSSPQ